jgi:hypothetical protein
MQAILVNCLCQYDHNSKNKNEINDPILVMRRDRHSTQYYISIERQDCHHEPAQQAKIFFL